MANNQIPQALLSLENGRRRLYRTRVYAKARQLLGIPPPALTQPIFMVGTVRSGSTLMGECLGAHPQILNVGFELSAEWHQYTGIPIATPTLDCTECPQYTEEHVTPELRAQAQNRFAELGLRRGGAKHVHFFNKNPHFWNKIPFIRAIFPDAKFIVLSRYLESTVASTKNLWEKIDEDWDSRHYLPEEPTACWSYIKASEAKNYPQQRLFPGGNGAVLAEYWLRVYEMIEQELPAESTLPIFYHDFIKSPHQTLQQIQEFIGISSKPYPLPVEIRQGRDNRWQQILTSEEQKDIAEFVAQNKSRLQKLSWAQCAPQHNTL